MKYHLIPSLLGAALLGLSACGGSDNNTPPDTGAVRAVNGTTDSNGLDVAVSNVGSFSGIGLDTGSGLTDVPLGSYKVQLTSNSIQFTVNNVSVDHNNVTTVFSYGATGASTEGGFPAEESVVAPTNGQAVVQPVHDALAASAADPTLSIYLVKPGSGIGSVTPLTAGFQQNPGSSAIAGGTYEIIVTNGSTVLFDSGPTGFALPATNGANVFQIGALDATSAQVTQHGSALVMLLLDNQGGNEAIYNYLAPSA